MKRKQVSIVNNKLEIIEILEDLKELAESDSIDSVEKDIIMVERINETLEKIEVIK